MRALFLSLSLSLSLWRSAGALSCVALALCACADSGPSSGASARGLEPPIPPDALDGAVVATEGHAGFTRGSFEVADDGAATYRVPLWAPSGRNDLEPSLSLDYHGRAGSGSVGLGWSVTGLGAVTRCRRTPAYDGASEGIDWSASDALCLDGRRLVASAGADPAYGDYRLAGDPFVKVVRVGAPGEAATTFELWRRDGRILHYGSASAPEAAVVEGPVGERDVSGAPTSGARGVYAWLLSKVEDRWGSYATYSYDRTEHADGSVEVRPSKIEYTGHPTLGSGQRRVLFEYDAADRPDPLVRYEAGLGLRSSRLLRAIAMEAPGTPAVVRRYELSHTTSAATGRSLLTEVRECDGAGVCRQPLRFEYQDAELPGADEDTGLSVASIEQVAQTRLFAADVDRNGRDDLLVGRPWQSTWQVLSDEGGSWALRPTELLPSSVLWPLDADGDGGVELLRAYVTGSGNTAVERAPLGKVCTEPTCHSWRFELGSGTPVGGCAGTPAMAVAVGDLDGDGAGDVLRGCEGGQWRTGHGPGVSLGAAFDPSASHRLADYAGSGRHELLLPGPTVWERHRLSGGGSPLPPLETNLPSDAAYVWLDVNGDGQGDALRFVPGGFAIRLGTGRGFGPEYAGRHPSDDTDWNPLVGGFQMLDGYETRRPHDVRVADVDRDGRDDFVVLFEVDAWPGGVGPEAQMVLHLSDGARYRSIGLGAPGVPVVVEPTLGTLETRAWPLTGLGDTDGDGLLEAYFVGGGGWDELTLRRRRLVSQVPDLMVRVRIGTTEQAAATYRVDTVSGPYQSLRGSAPPGVFSSLAPNPLYEPGAGCVYPQRCLNDRTVAVATHTDEVGRTFEHRYADARVDVSGHGWLGFTRRTVTATDTGESETVTYEQDDPHAHRPLTSLRTVVEPDRSRCYATRTEYGWIDQPVGQVTARLRGAIDTHWYELDTWADQAWESCDEADLEGVEPVRELHQRWTYDAHGALVTAERTVPGSLSTSATIVNEHRPGTSPGDRTGFLLGLPVEVTVTSTGQGSPAVPRTRTVRLAYSPEGAVFEHTREPSDPDLFLLTTYARDARGLITQVTRLDAAGRQRAVELGYDDDGHFLRRLAAEHLESWVAVHPGLGVPVYERSPAGIVTRTRYDGLGRLRETVLPDRTDLTDYAEVTSSPQLEVRARAGHGAEVRDRIDSAGRLRERRVGLPEGWSVSRLGYDAQGRLASTESPHLETKPPALVTSYGYDALGRVRAVGYSTPGPDVTVERSGLDVIVTDRAGRRRHVTLDSAGRPVRVEQAAPGGSTVRTEYRHGAFGVLEQVTDHAGLAWTAAHDAWNRPVLVVDPDSGTRALEHTAFGELDRVRDGAGAVLRDDEHDALGRLVSRWTPEEGTTRFEWDTAPFGQGLLHRAVTSTNVLVEHRYDAMGRVAGRDQTVEGKVYSLDFAYDAAGRLGTIAYPDDGDGRLRVRHDYEPTGHPSALHVQREGAPVWTTVWQATSRDPRGAISAERTGGGVETLRTFDALTGRASSVHSAASSGAVVLDLAQTYGPDGAIEERTRGGALEAFTYDSLRRLQGWTFGSTAHAYGYDPLGNLVDKDGVPQAFGGPGAPPHAVRSVAGGPDMVYDDRGRRREGLGLRVEYTSFDLPRSIEGPGGTTAFDYDADGNRVSRRGPAGSAGYDSAVYVAGLYELREDASGKRHVFHVQGPEGEVLTLFADASGDTARYLHHDEQGSLLAVTDEAGGVVERLRYDPYGGRLDEHGDPLTAFSSPMTRGYTGHLHDDDLGLVHMGGRTYDPSTGRFLSPDPLIASVYDRQALNGYSYVLGDPTNLVDPSGFDPCDDGACEGNGVLGVLLAGLAAVFGSDSGGGGDGSAGDAGGAGPTPPARPEPTPERARPAPDVVDAASGLVVEEAGRAVQRATDLSTGFGDVLTTDPTLGPFLGTVGRVPGMEWVNPAGGPFSWTRNYRHWCGNEDVVDESSLHYLGGQVGAVAFESAFAVLAGGGAAAGRLVTGEVVAAETAALVPATTDAAAVAARGASQVAGQGFRSFSAAKRALGPAGPGRQWHHIVEQGGNVERFGAEAIHNTSNLVRVDTAVHRQITGFYSSKQPFTGGQTVRQWLRSQSFDEQMQFGLDTLRRFGGGQ